MFEDEDEEDEDDDEEVDDGDIIPLLVFTIRLLASLYERFIDELVCSLVDDVDELDEVEDGDGDILTELTCLLLFAELFCLDEFELVVLLLLLLLLFNL